MGKLAFIFSGQGAQYAGMGRELAENYEVSKKIFEEADNSLGFSLSSLCFDGPKEELDRTENTQPSIVTVSTAALKILESKGIIPDIVAGLSLGEYSAHVCSETLKFSDAVKLVKKRGKYMQEAVPEGLGTMAAVLRMEVDSVNDICNKVKELGMLVEAANYNCPGQIVIGGETEGVKKACEMISEAGGKAVPLSVSGPFHTSMLKGAAVKLAEELKTVDFQEFKVPVVTNVTGEIIRDKAQIKDLLTTQVMSPVFWENSIRTMVLEGVDTFVEIGPGKVLSGFVKKIDRKLVTLNVEDIKSLENTLEVLEGRQC